MLATTLATLAMLSFAARPSCRSLPQHAAKRVCVRAIRSEAAGRLKKVVFLGTPPVAARSLELLLEGAAAGRGDYEIAAVVSQPPTRSGRKMKLTPSPVQQLAEAEGLHLFTPPNAKDEEFLQALEERVGGD